MLFTNFPQIEEEEYQDIELRAGQYIEFIDNNGFPQVGEVLRVDAEINMCFVVYGDIIKITDWVDANDITEA